MHFTSRFYGAVSLCLLALGNIVASPLVALADPLQGQVEQRTVLPDGGLPSNGGSRSLRLARPVTDPILANPLVGTVQDQGRKPLTGGVQADRHLNWSVAVVQTWPGGAPPVVPEALTGMTPTVDPIASPPAKPLSEPASDIAAAFPDQTPNFCARPSSTLPGTTTSQTTTTNSSTSSTTSSSSWNSSNSSNSSSSRSGWQSRQSARGGFGMIGLGMAIPAFGIGYAMPHWRMPGFNMGPYAGYAIGGAIAIGALWAGYKAMKKRRGFSAATSSNNICQSSGSKSTTNTCQNTEKTTTTTSSTPGETVPGTGTECLPVPVEPTAISAVPEPSPEPITDAPLLAAVPAAIGPPTKKLIVVPWDKWYTGFAGAVYQRWSQNEPYAGEALAKITVTDKHDVSITILPASGEAGVPTMPAQAEADFDRLVTASVTQLNHSGQVGFPPQTQRKAVSFILGFSAENGGPSGCNAVNICDNEQYYAGAADKAQLVSHRN